MWGANEAEIRTDYPCDAVERGPTVACYRAINIDAPVAVVFRWLCQLRRSPYSYDIIDNLGRRSSRQLTPGLEELRVGQSVMTIFELASFVVDEHFTIRARRRARGVIGDLVISYVTRPDGLGGTRLIVKLTDVRLGGAAWLRQRALAWGDLFMMHRQLLNLRKLAEQTAATSPGRT